MDPTGINCLSVKMNNKSFPLDWKHIDIGAYVSIQDVTYDWHNRLGHINIESLKLMLTKDLVGYVARINAK